MGVGAVSRFDGMYVRNTNNLKLYMQNAGDYEKVTAKVSVESRESAMLRYVCSRLESAEGFSQKAFEDRFEEAVPDRVQHMLQKILREGAGVEEDGMVRMTDPLFAW